MKRHLDPSAKGFFQKPLVLVEPWQIVAVGLMDEDCSLEIEPKWPVSYPAPYGDCGRACAVHDYARTRWGGICKR